MNLVDLEKFLKKSTGKDSNTGLFELQTHALTIRLHYITHKSAYVV